MRRENARSCSAAVLGRAQGSKGMRSGYWASVSASNESVLLSRRSTLAKLCATFGLSTITRIMQGEREILVIHPGGLQAHDQIRHLGQFLGEFSPLSGRIRERLRLARYAIAPAHQVQLLRAHINPGKVRQLRLRFLRHDLISS